MIIKAREFIKKNLKELCLSIFISSFKNGEMPNDGVYMDVFNMLWVKGTSKADIHSVIKEMVKMAAMEYVIESK
jgi:hypothetical protein